MLSIGRPRHNSVDGIFCAAIKDSLMQNSNENKPGPAGSSHKNEQESSEAWNIPRPEIIPAPTYWPFVLSLGATLVGLGVLTSNVISVTGTVLFILAIVKWVGELANEDR